MILERMMGEANKQTIVLIRLWAEVKSDLIRNNFIVIVVFVWIKVIPLLYIQNEYKSLH